VCAAVGVLQPPARDPSEKVTPFVNIIDPNLKVVMKDPNNANNKKARWVGDAAAWTTLGASLIHVHCLGGVRPVLYREFFLHLSLNHDVMPEGDSEEKLVYSASSPDESALVYAAKVPRHTGPPACLFTSCRGCP
jgi:hypothetical protein